MVYNHIIKSVIICCDCQHYLKLILTTNSCTVKFLWASLISIAIAEVCQKIKLQFGSENWGWHGENVHIRKPFQTVNSSSLIKPSFCRASHRVTTKLQLIYAEELPPTAESRTLLFVFFFFQVRTRKALFTREKSVQMTVRALVVQFNPERYTSEKNRAQDKLKRENLYGLLLTTRQLHNVIGAYIRTL